MKVGEVAVFRTVYNYRSRRSEFMLLREQLAKCTNNANILLSIERSNMYGKYEIQEKKKNANNFESSTNMLKAFVIAFQRCF